MEIAVEVNTTSTAISTNRGTAVSNFSEHLALKQNYNFLARECIWRCYTVFDNISKEQSSPNGVLSIRGVVNIKLGRSFASLL